MYLWSVNNSVYQYFQFFSLSRGPISMCLFTRKNKVFFAAVLCIIEQTTTMSGRVRTRQKCILDDFKAALCYGVRVYTIPLQFSLAKAHIHPEQFLIATRACRDTPKVHEHNSQKANRRNRKSCVWLTSCRRREQKQLYLKHQHRQWWYGKT